MQVFRLKAFTFVVILLMIQNVLASSAGLPLSEDFSSTALNDTTKTTASYSTQEQELILQWKKSQGIVSSLAVSPTGSDITTDSDNTYSVALGDVDGDGDLDMVVGNNGANKLYLNDGTSTPFSSATSSTISTDTDNTRSVALGDVDGDGDLDIVFGNSGANKLYLNDGTSTPFASATGSTISKDTDSTQSVSLGDVDGDGDLDIVAGNYGSANKLYLNDGTSTPFASATGSTISKDTDSTQSVALGDVDGDGDLDMVAGNNGLNKLYLNDGTLTPFSGATGSTISTDTDDTRSVALGDVDGDGDLDVVAGNYRRANKLYLNEGTSTPFASATGSDISTDTDITYSVALGDVDGDGDLDMVVGNYGRANKLYLNEGTSTPFASATGSDISTDTDNTTSVALGDVDGDGDLDIVAGNYEGVNKLYLNDGISTPFTSATGSDISTDTDNTIPVALGDVDGDGDLDIVAGNYGRANKLYLNDGTSTPFSSATGSDISTDTDDTNSVALGDVDGDGDLDIVAGNYGRANKLYLNDGTSTPFSSATGSNISTDSDSTYSVALGDVDGDGDLDMVVGNYGGVNKLYLNEGTSTPFASATGSTISTDTDNTISVALGDVDGDGDLDIVAGNYGSANKLYLNNGTSTPFASVTSSTISADADNTLSVALGDVDGDGDLDIVAGNNGANKLYLNDGTSTPFASATSSTISTDTDNTLSVALGDVDSDGDLDIVAGNYGGVNKLYLNDGTSTPFSSVTSSTISTDSDSTNSVALGDVDGDGDLDMVVGNNGAKNSLYLNNKEFIPFKHAVESDITTDSDETHDIAIGDIDRDGDLDMVVGNEGTNKLYLNNGSLTPFYNVNGTDISSDTDSTRSVVLGDFNNDGYLDFIAGNYSDTANKLYLNNGTADPFSGVTANYISNDRDSTKSIDFGDVDRDGDLDVVVGNLRTRKIYLNNGTATPFSGVSGNEIGSDVIQTNSIVLGDVDSDGDLDVVVAHYNAPNKYYLNNGTDTPFSGVNGIDINEDGADSVALGDIDKDGDLDIVLGYFGTNKLYLNNGTDTPFSGVSGSDIGSFTMTRAITLDDIDRDGYLDIIVANLNSKNKLYLNNRTATPFNEVSGIDIGISENIMSIALGDINGDGDTDIVSGNYSQRNKFYQRQLFRTHLNKITSIEVDTQTEEIQSAKLTATQTTPSNTSVDYYLSNNGGVKYFQVKSGEFFTFPTTGTDLRYKAKLNSLSPVLTPRVTMINIELKNQEPTDISLSSNTIVENNAIGDVIGDLNTTDMDAGDTHTYSLCGGTDDANFTIDGNELKSNAVFDYETKSSYSICVRSTDSESGIFDKNITVDITNVNEYTPTVTSTPITTGEVNEFYTYTAVGDDIDGLADLNWSVRGTLPSSLSLNVDLFKNIGKKDSFMENIKSGRYDIAVDANNTPYVVVLQEDSKAINLMKYDGSSWVSASPDITSSSEIVTFSLKFDNNNAVYVEYSIYNVAGNNSIRTIVKLEENSWLPLGEPQTVSYTSVRTDEILQFDNQNTPYIVNMEGPGNDDKTLSVVKYNGTDWEKVGDDLVTSKGVTGLAYALGIDNNDIPYIAISFKYPNESYSSRYNEVIKKFDGNSWEPVIDESKLAEDESISQYALTFDANNVPNLLKAIYNSEESRYKVNFQKFNGNSFDTISTSERFRSYGSYIDIDFSGTTPYFVHYHSDIMYSAIVFKYDGTSWKSFGNIGSENDRTDEPRMAIDNKGIPYIIHKGKNGNGNLVKKYSPNEAVLSGYLYTIGTHDVNLTLSDGTNEVEHNFQIIVKGEAQTLTPVLEKGSEDGTTKVTHTPKSGNTLKYMYSNTPVDHGIYGEDAPLGSLPYISGTNIPSAQSGKYLIVYEVNSDGDIVGFYQKELESDDIYTAPTTTDPETGTDTPTTPATSDAEVCVENVKSSLYFDDIKANNISQEYLTTDMDFISAKTAVCEDATITWKSSAESVVSNDGEVASTNENKTIAVTATITNGEYSATKKFLLTVTQTNVTDKDALKVIVFEKIKGENNRKDTIITDLELPETSLGKDINWTSVPDIITYDGNITRGNSDTNVTLTATIGTDTKEFTLVVKSNPSTDDKKLSDDANWLDYNKLLGKNRDNSNILYDLENPLPTTAPNGSTITWKSNNTAIGTNSSVTRDSTEDIYVVLTATITLNGKTTTKEFIFKVLQNKIKTKVQTSFKQIDDSNTTVSVIFDTNSSTDLNTTANFDESFNGKVEKSIDEESIKSTVEFEDRKLNVYLNTDGTTQSQTQMFDENNNSVISSLIVNIPQSQTDVDSDGNTTTTVNSTNSSIEAKLNSDGSVSHKVKQTNGLSSQASSKIAGSKTIVNSDGSVETTSELIESGFIIKAIVTTDTQGQSKTKFVKIDLSTGKQSEISNTLQDSTPYPVGNRVDIDKIDTKLFIKTVAPLGDTNLIIE